MLDSSRSSFIEVPRERLSPAVLQAVIEEYCCREGTDYGHGEWELADKVAMVEAQLTRGTAKIVFDPSSESVQIIPARDLPAAKN